MLDEGVGQWFQTALDAAGDAERSAAADSSFEREGNRYDGWHRLTESHREAPDFRDGTPTWSAAPVDEAFGTRDYAYDALGRMIRSGEQDFWYSAAWQQIVVAEWDLWDGWQPVVENVWSLAYVDAMLFQDAPDAYGQSSRIYALHDASYDVTALVRKVGGVWQVTQRHLFDPYGKVWAVLNGLWQPFTTGAPEQPLTWQYLHKGGYYTVDCLYHFRKRSYDPSTGKWLQRDPAGYLDSLNLHEYLGSSPVNAVDPQGEFVILGVTITASLIAGYLAKTAVVSAAETTIEYGIAQLQGQEYNWGVGFAKNMGVNAVVGLIPGGAIAKTAKKGSRLAKLLKAGIYTTKLALRTTGDAAFDTWQYGGSFGENMLYSGIGNVGGDLVGLGLRYLGRSRVGRFFYDPRDFRNCISRKYWAVHGPANGRSLHHWLFRQQWTRVPVGIRNAGFNLLELPSLRGVFHRSLSLNTWMGFARRWGGQRALKAAVVEWGIRAAVPASIVAAGYMGWELGDYLSEEDP